ncbi:MAG: molecular chaperone GrpE [Thermoleophilaceae bacterium]|jgi:molecular chaperone GrpE|nr:molecular chaperone GrpE [Thermoleophilaceae bacterium]
MPSSPANEGEERVAEREAPADGADAQPNGELTELQGRYDALEDRYKRALADVDNYRKRAGREVDRRVEERRETLLRDWLEAFDSVERAIRMGSPENPLFQGLRAVLEQMEAILERQGVTRIGAAGEQFDPERHDAVAVVPSEELPDRTIVEVTRTGFALGDRVLRPAQVVVSRHPAAEG